jgi:LmbE family N-acetylglucosaminyl deacetylase
MKLPENKTIVCIFAHPDDEAFGPGGTIALLSKKNDLYILCATKGEAGKNRHTDKETPLQRLRSNELKASAMILGVKKVQFLNYIDGSLSNSLYHKLAKSICSCFRCKKSTVFELYRR